MFEKVEALDKSKHQDLKFNPANNYSFARDISVVPISYTELVQASKYYPIVISGQERPVPQVLLSLKQGENNFTDENGRWKVPYVPAHIRRYPFILAKADAEGNYAVAIDPAAPHLSKEQGDPLYTANGEPSEVLNRAMESLKRYHQEMLDTERLFQGLQEKDLLWNKQFTIGEGENQRTVRGFKAVDTEKLGEVDNETLGDWVKRGVMGLIYAHLHSLDNVGGLIERQ